MKSLTRIQICVALGIAMFLGSPVVSAQIRNNPLSPSDAEFISQLYQETIASERLADLAVNWAKRKSVRALAVKATAALRDCRGQVKALARRKGVEVSDDLTAHNQDVVDSLSNAGGGKDLDKQYLAILLKYLPMILDRCQAITGTTADPDLQKLASSLIPVVKSLIADTKTAKSSHARKG